MASCPKENATNRGIILTFIFEQHYYKIKIIMNFKTISGNIVDVLRSEIFPGTLTITDGIIADIRYEDKKYAHYIMPGFIDSHLHIESSMLVPSELSRIAAIHGTVAVISDPHEIANVHGIDGVGDMIDDAKTVPIKFYFGAPSCVPASDFETNGAVIGPDQIEKLLKMDEIRYLAEVMNFPGVINRQSDVMKKIGIAKKYGKVIDGHAPGLRGESLRKYVEAGISTDHECFQKDEALEKTNSGMKIMIREGSAAKNFDELICIVEDHYKDCMFCSDDIHPDDLLNGHINLLVKRALAYGIDIMKILRVACINPVLHYKLDVGLLRKGDSADFIIVDSLKNLGILATYIRGDMIAGNGKTLIPRGKSKIINNFQTDHKNVEDFLIPAKEGNINVIEAIDGQLITNKILMPPKIADGFVVSDVDRDMLKIVVINRYRTAKIATGFVKGFGLKRGAIASSVAHDSHNIIAIGVNDRAICHAVNLIIKAKGGISAVSKDKELLLPLPIAGIMSNLDYLETAEKYTLLTNMAIKYLDSTLHSPFMTLSFMALLVTPKLKISDKGLFDGEQFKFIDLFAVVSDKNL